MKPDMTTQEAYLAAYESYNDAIFRYCFFETSNREVALDITQDTFMKVWEYMQNGNTILNMRAFLYRVAGNLVIDYRRKKKATSLDALMDDGFDVGHDEKNKTIDAIDGRKVMELMKEIPEKYRDVIIMRYVEDLSIKEIAEVTGETENNISVRLHRGLDKVRALAEEQETKL
jgi:RNA polymerase sigma-70 factor (ECF subfamily)